MTSAETRAGAWPGRYASDLGFRVETFAWLLTVTTLGLGASSIANRLVFAVWGLVGALALGLVTARAWATGSSRRRGMAGTWAVALAVFGALVGLERGALDLGARATMGSLYRSWVSEPAGYLALAALVGAAAAGSALRSRKGVRSR